MQKEKRANINAAVQLSFLDSISDDDVDDFFIITPTLFLFSFFSRDKNDTTLPCRNHKEYSAQEEKTTMR